MTPRRRNRRPGLSAYMFELTWKYATGYPRCPRSLDGPLHHDLRKREWRISMPERVNA